MDAASYDKLKKALLKNFDTAVHRHLFSKHIIDKPLCTCGEDESRWHFVFDCLHYD